MSRFPGRSHVLAACVGALLFLAGFATGCGSGDDEPSQPTVGTESASGGPDAAAMQPDTARPTREARTEKAPHKKPVDKAGKPRDEGEKAKPQRTPRHGGGADATGRAEAESCVERFDRETCAAMAKPAGGPSQSVEEPADCTKVMSKRECEELAAAQESDRQQDDSVNLEECIDNPTPHCEEVLRPALEAQGASRGAGQ